MVASMGHLLKPHVTMLKDIDRLSELTVVPSHNERLWIFGYGSILWKTGFEYNNKVVGHVKGYVRRFWQGNVTHRGTPDMPGRVATLVKRSMGCAWGAAYEVVGSQITKALEHLGMRECLLGGYDVKFVSFSPRGCPETTVPTLVFNASTDNPYFMGKSPLDVIAHEVVDAEGASGHNIEYVLRLADYIRQVIPEDQDEHLFGLESHILRLLEARHINQERLIQSASQRTHLYVHTQVVTSSMTSQIPVEFNNNDQMEQDSFEKIERRRKRSNSQSA